MPEIYVYGCGTSVAPLLVCVGVFTSSVGVCARASGLSCSIRIGSQFYLEIWCLIQASFHYFNGSEI